MKYLKRFNESRTDFGLFGLSKDPYGANKKDTTKTDPRITHLSIRLFKLFQNIGIICDYKPIYRVNNIIGTNQQIRIGEGHYFTIKLNDIKKYSVIDCLLTDKEKEYCSNYEYEFAVNINCDTLTKEMPQMQLGDDMWEKSIDFITKYIKRELDQSIKEKLISLINANKDFDVINMKDKKFINIPENVLKTIMLNISEQPNNQVIAKNIKRHNVRLYSKIMVYYNTLKENDPLSNMDLKKASDLTDMGFNDY